LPSENVALVAFRDLIVACEGFSADTYAGYGIVGDGSGSHDPGAVEITAVDEHLVVVATVGLT